MRKLLIACIVLLFFSCTTYNIIYEFNIPYNDVKTENTSISFTNPYKDKGPLQLKGALHNHSNNSDSPDIDPFSLGVKFRDEGGFDFYTISDHNFVTYDPGVPGIVWIGNAVEDTKRKQHLNVFNLPEDYKYKNKGSDINNLIAYYKNLGAYVSYNHPDLKGSIQSSGKILSVNHVDFVEIINPIPEECTERAFDLLLSKGIKAFGLGIDDFHYNYKRNMDPDYTFNKSYIIVYAHKKEREDIWNGITKGCFYAVSGNIRIDISCENDTINVSSDEISTFEFIGLNIENPSKGKILYTVTESYNAAYTITGNEGYVRVRVTNPQGQAFSQPFMIES